MDQMDKNDFFQCALRETHEEYFHKLDHEFEKIHQLPGIIKHSPDIFHDLIYKFRNLNLWR